MITATRSDRFGLSDRQARPLRERLRLGRYLIYYYSIPTVLYLETIDYLTYLTLAWTGPYRILLLPRPIVAHPPFYQYIVIPVVIVPLFIPRLPGVGLMSHIDHPMVNVVVWPCGGDGCP